MKCSKKTSINNDDSTLQRLAVAMIANNLTIRASSFQPRVLTDSFLYLIFMSTKIAQLDILETKTTF